MIWWFQYFSQASVSLISNGTVKRGFPVFTESTLGLPLADWGETWPLGGRRVGRPLQPSCCRADPRKRGDSRIGGDGRRAVKPTATLAPHVRTTGPGGGGCVSSQRGRRNQGLRANVWPDDPIALTFVKRIMHIHGRKSSKYRKEKKNLP